MAPRPILAHRIDCDKIEWGHSPEPAASAKTGSAEKIAGAKVTNAIAGPS
jgi:hypothetical protein